MICDECGNELIEVEGQHVMIYWCTCGFKDIRHKKDTTDEQASDS